MYDEPEMTPEDFVGRGRSDRGFTSQRALRFLGAAVPALAGFFWLSALLETGPLVGHAVAGLGAFVFSIALWVLTWGRTVKPA